MFRRVPSEMTRHLIVADEYYENSPRLRGIWSKKVVRNNSTNFMPRGSAASYKWKYLK